MRGAIVIRRGETVGDQLQQLVLQRAHAHSARRDPRPGQHPQDPPPPRPARRTASGRTGEAAATGATALVIADRAMNFAPNPSDPNCTLGSSASGSAFAPRRGGEPHLDCGRRERAERATSGSESPRLPSRAARGWSGSPFGSPTTQGLGVSRAGDPAAPLQHVAQDLLGLRELAAALRREPQIVARSQRVFGVLAENFRLQRDRCRIGHQHQRQLRPALDGRRGELVGADLAGTSMRARQRRRPQPGGSVNRGGL